MSAVENALRNTVRNGRRSVPALVAIALGTASILLFNGYVSYTIEGLQTGTVRSTGHLEVVTRGFLDFGRGNPGRFSIRGYERIAAAIRHDPALAAMVTVATPELDVQGIVGTDGASASSSLSGDAWIAADRQRLAAWDGYGLHIPVSRSALGDDAPDGGTMGVGLAQMLDLCGPLHIPQCRRLPPAARDTVPAAKLPSDLAGLATAEAATDGTRTAAGGPVTVDLLAASPAGLPNVVRLHVLRADRQAIRDIDAIYVAMPLALGQRLVFGPGEKAASAVVVQLRSTDMMPAARSRLEALVGRLDPTLEVVDFHEVSPIYDQIVGNYRTIFRFIAVLMALITMFSVANTVNMAISERTREIGTLRALGFDPGAIRRIFILEGGMLGLVGTSGGAVLGLGLAAVVNHAGLTWTPPGRSHAIPLRIASFADPSLIWATVLVLSILACLSAFRPASRASNLPITKALRHA